MSDEAIRNPIHPARRILDMLEECELTHGEELRVFFEDVNGRYSLEETRAYRLADWLRGCLNENDGFQDSEVELPDPASIQSVCQAMQLNPLIQTTVFDRKRDIPLSERHELHHVVACHRSGKLIEFDAVTKRGERRDAAIERIYRDHIDLFGSPSIVGCIVDDEPLLNATAFNERLSLPSLPLHHLQDPVDCNFTELHEKNSARLPLVGATDPIGWESIRKTFGCGIEAIMDACAELRPPITVDETLTLKGCRPKTGVWRASVVKIHVEGTLSTHPHEFNCIGAELLCEVFNMDGDAESLTTEVHKLPNEAAAAVDAMKGLGLRFDRPVDENFTFMRAASLIAEGIPGITPDVDIMPASIGEEGLATLEASARAVAGGESSRSADPGRDVAR